VPPEAGMMILEPSKHWILDTAELGLLFPTEIWNKESFHCRVFFPGSDWVLQTWNLKMKLKVKNNLCKWILSFLSLENMDWFCKIWMMKQSCIEDLLPHLGVLYFFLTLSEMELTFSDPIRTDLIQAELPIHPISQRA